MSNSTLNDLVSDSASNIMHTVFNTGAAVQKTFKISQRQIDAIMVPDGYTLQTFEHLEAHPPHLVSRVECHTLEALRNYVEKFVDLTNEDLEESAMTFIDREAHRFTTVLDYHHMSHGPAWCNHLVTYECPITPEWKRWQQFSGVKMSQHDMALFIEDMAPEIMEPTGADMLEIASSLTAKNNVEFRSGIRLDNGEVKLTYNEVIEGAAGRTGNLSIPQQIKIVVPIHRGGIHYEMDARWRYTVRDGKLSLWYDLIRPQRIVDAALDELITKLRDAFKGLPIIEGKWTGM